MQRFLISCVVAQTLAILALLWLLFGQKDAGDARAENARSDAPEARVATRTEASPAAVAPARQQAIDDPTAGLAGTLLFGDVRGEDGAAVPDGTLHALREGDMRGVSCNIDGERGYAIPGLAAGRWTLTVHAPGFRTQTIDVELNGGLLRRDLRLDRSFELKVAVVTPDGVPLATALTDAKLWRIQLGILGAATLEEPGESLPITAHGSVHDAFGIGTWRDNRFGRGVKLPPEFLGVLELDRAPPVWVSLVNRHVVVAKQLVQPGQDEVRFLVDPAQVRSTLSRARMYVVDSQTRLPLVGAIVGFADPGIGGGPTPKVGADGLVVCEQLPPGLLELTIFVPEHELYHRFVRLDPGSDVDLGVIAVDPKAEVAGFVTDAAGNPAPGATVSYVRLDRCTPDAPLGNGMAVRTDTEGRFALEGVGRGRQLIRAMTADRTAAATWIVDTSAGALLDLRLQLTATIAVPVANQIPDGKSFLVTFHAPDGEPRWRWTLRPGANHPLPVLPGSYSVEIRDEQSGAVRAFPFTAAPGAKLRIP